VRDLLAIIGLALASCFAVGLLGTALLYLVRRKSLRYQPQWSGMSTSLPRT
jgi:hypothetical protein